MKILSIKKILLFAFFLSCLNIKAAENTNYLNRCNLVLIDVIMEDIFNPPVASRIQTYANIAAYEILATDSTGRNKSIAGNLNNLQKLEPPKVPINYSLAAEVGFIDMAKKLVYSEYILQDFLDKEVTKWRLQITDTNLLNNSIAYGHKAALHFIKWSTQDNYAHTRTLQRYVLADSLGAWKPTAPEYANALEPNWFLMRSFVADSSNYIKPKPNVKYSQSKKSLYYKNAMAVYKSSLSHDSNKINTALYWDDNPNTAIVKGHLKYFIHKATPGGHWLKITSQILQEKNIPDTESSIIFTLVSLSIYEGFLNCWATKYQTNAIRPETYIIRLINTDWKPLIETPPFPEYTSGHSVISAAAATILTLTIGSNHAFTDSSQVYLNMPPRKFNSFLEAAQEASISRFYGGIHYMPALDNGALQGEQVAIYVLQKMLLNTH